MRVFWLGRLEDKDHLFFEHPFSIKVKSHSKKKKEKKSLKVKPWCLLDSQMTDLLPGPCSSWGT